jgi:diaminopimelate epimerase
VVPVAEPSALELTELGPDFESWPYFPNRTNTEFVRVLASDALEMRVWERGSGETLACGTGACASVAAMASAGQLSREATVHLLGGDLRIRWETESGHVFMTGPAVTVFDGELAD